MKGINASNLGLFRLLTRLLAHSPRQVSGFFMRLALRLPPLPRAIQVHDAFIVGPASSQLRLRVYQPGLPPAQRPKAPALLWMHGGGYVIGMPEQDDAYLVPFIQEVGLVVVSVDYRLAPEYPFPAPLEDCFSALQWLAAQAEFLNIDPQRIAIGGSSAGAGLAAALAQLSGDRGAVRPAFQLLVYPMLEDRTAAREEIDPQAHRVWNNASNRFGWEAYLNQACGAETVPAGAVPARRLDLTGLPPAWIGIGSQDLFFEEATAYAQRLKQAGVACELVTVQDAFHAFDLFAPKMPAVEDFRRSQVQALKNALIPPA